MSVNLSPDDLAHVLARLPERVRSLVARELVLAGGFIRAVIAREPVSDIDLFAPTGDLAKAAADALHEEWKGSAQTITDNAITVWRNGETPVQFITRWTFPSAEAVLSHFDFTICQAALQLSTCDLSVCSESFYPDLAARRLRYTSPANHDAPASLLRAFKYAARGYRIAPDSIAAIVERCQPPEPDGGWGSSDDYERDRSGWLLGRLREIDPLPAGVA